MRAMSNLTPLLVRVRNAGLAVRVDRGDLVVTPRAKLTPELREELLYHKPHLILLLAWDEPVAQALLEDAMSYLAEFYVATDHSVDASPPWTPSRTR